MDQREVRRDAVGERRVDQEGFPYPGLSEEYGQGLPRLQALYERLHSRCVAPTRKEPGGIYSRRKRLVFQGIKSAHHGHAATFSLGDAGLSESRYSCPRA